jgi:hypothetical protein
MTNKENRNTPPSPGDSNLASNSGTSDSGIPTPDSALRTPHSPTYVTSFSNGIRLTGRQWIVVGLFALQLFFDPWLWKHLEKFEPEPDYRLPHDLSNDYWLFERFADLAATRFDTLLLGDSVVWGEYVTRQETLSHYLNQLCGKEAFANLGLDGAHPLALEGLVDHYAAAIIGKNVVLQCNPLWLSSKRTDLQDDQRTNEFNHPGLVPQFVPWIPSYKKELSTRIGVVVQQHVALDSWAIHLQQTYYDHTSLPDWTLKHPYANPLAPLTRGLPPTDDVLRHPSRPWFEGGNRPTDYAWVDLESSLQWKAFQRVADTLKSRGNRVFVLVGPFNEHLLTPQSRDRYREIKAGITAWLQAQQIPHAAPDSLPSEQYGDASHPLANGYARLAEVLWTDPIFVRK